jgi:hypothetical protein
MVSLFYLYNNPPINRYYAYAVNKHVCFFIIIKFICKFLLVFLHQ